MKEINNLSKTKIKNRIGRKTNPQIAEIIKLTSKNKSWYPILKILSNSTRRYSSVNLIDIEKIATAGDTVAISGKVLSLGDITKKIRICSLGISKSAREKLKKTKSEYVFILDEIKSNPKAQGVKIIR